MKSKTLIATAALVASMTAQAAPVYYYPDATSDDWVVMAGPDSATVCTNALVTNYTAWTCRPVVLYGAPEPVEVQVQWDGPVKVLNARWAWIKRGDDLIPMLAD